MTADSLNATRLDRQRSVHIDLLMRHAQDSEGDPIYLDRLEAIPFRPGWRRQPTGLGWPQ